MAHIVISVLGLDSTLQTLLTNFDKKVDLKASPDNLRFRMLSNNTVAVATAVNSVDDNLLYQLTMESSL